MARVPLGTVLEHIRTLAAPADCGLADGELLRRFAGGRDRAAFTALIGRHGALVWNVCRHLLPHHDAADAFQATFLVLARKADSIRQAESVASWLYGVAHRTAMKARSNATAPCWSGI